MGQVVMEHDESGELLWGAFYAISILHLDARAERFVNIGNWGDCILGVREEDAAWAECVEIRDAREEVCENCHRQLASITTTPLVYDLFGTEGPLGPLVPETQFSDVFVVPSVAEALQDSSLTGFDLSKVRMRYSQPSQIDDPGLFHLAFVGPNAARPPRIMVPEYNRCPFCGEAEVVCERCFGIQHYCRSCSAAMTVDQRYCQGPDDPRYVLRSRRKIVLDGVRWQGHDFLAFPEGTGIVSRRVVNWLLDQQAKSFVCRPVAMDVSGTDAETKECLTRLRE